jgi:phosphoenolpyruvate-protein kinase (PTS system EI component)
MMRTGSGIGIGEGIAIGTIRVVRRSTLPTERRNVTDTQGELARFAKADNTRDKAEAELEKIYDDKEITDDVLIAAGIGAAVSKSKKDKKEKSAPKKKQESSTPEPYAAKDTRKKEAGILAICLPLAIICIAVALMLIVVYGILNRLGFTILEVI